MKKFFIGYIQTVTWAMDNASGIAVGLEMAEYYSKIKKVIEKGL